LRQYARRLLLPLGRPSQYTIKYRLKLLFGHIASRLLAAVIADILIEGSITKIVHRGLALVIKRADERPLAGIMTSLQTLQQRGEAGAL
jgi:hypothetical protein